MKLTNAEPKTKREWLHYALSLYKDSPNNLIDDLDEILNDLIEPTPGHKWHLDVIDEEEFESYHYILSIHRANNATTNPN